MNTTTRPQRIQRRRTKGWQMPENTVYVGRPTKWGNPWKAGDKSPYGNKVANARHAAQIFAGFAPQNEVLVAAARAELRRLCLKGGCRMPVVSGQIACRDHWADVPTQLKHDLACANTSTCTCGGRAIGMRSRPC